MKEDETTVGTCLMFARILMGFMRRYQELFSNRSEGQHGAPAWGTTAGSASRNNWVKSRRNVTFLELIVEKMKKYEINNCSRGSK